MCIIGVFFKHETAYEVRISDWSSDVCSSDLIPERVYKNAPPHLRTIFELGKAWGKRDFLVYDGERLNFDDHYRASVAFGRVLADRLRVRTGDRARKSVVAGTRVSVRISPGGSRTIKKTNKKKKGPSKH